MRRKKIGDVYEIKTSKGLSYFQYTHEYTKPPVWGSLIRVLDGFYQERPSLQEIYEIVENPHRFQTFCFLQAAIKDGEVEFVENFPVPEFAQKFPVFKNSMSLTKKDSEEESWSLWDGEKSWKVGKLSKEEQMKYPLKELCSATSLIRSIETGKSLGVDLC